MSSLSISGATIGFNAEDVKSVNYNPDIPFIWLIMEDGSQLNLPVTVCMSIASKLEDRIKQEPKFL